MKAFLKRPDCEIYFEVTGSGPALVFAHGLGGNYLSWWQQIQYFSEKFTCITFSHRGFWPNAASAAIPPPSVFAGDLSALVDHLQLETVALVAQSFGGWTCLEYARLQPNRVRALVLASSTGTLDFAAIRHPEMERLQEWREWTGEEKRRLAGRGISPAAGERMAEEQPALHYLYQQLNELTPADFREALRTTIHSARTLAPESFAGLRTPLLLVTGEEDLLFPPAAAAAAASLIPGACLKSMPQTGHSAYFERAVSFNKIIEEFLFKTTN